MREMKLLGATLLHTRYGHWQHPQSGRLFIRPVRDGLRNYPGLVTELLAIRRRALHGQQTVEDQQRLQWLAQAGFGALDIYQRGISCRPLSREEMLADVTEWLADQEDALTLALFAPVLAEDNGTHS